MSSNRDEMERRLTKQEDTTVALASGYCKRIAPGLNIKYDDIASVITKYVNYIPLHFEYNLTPVTMIPAQTIQEHKDDIDDIDLYDCEFIVAVCGLKREWLSLITFIFLLFILICSVFGFNYLFLVVLCFNILTLAQLYLQ